MPSLWRHNCICRTPHPISMKILRDKMVHRKKFDDVIGYMFSKIFFEWNGWTDRDESLHVWPPVHDEQKVHTYDVICHMVYQQYWIYPTPIKIHHSKEVLARVCDLWLLFFLLEFVTMPDEQCLMSNAWCFSYCLGEKVFALTSHYHNNGWNLMWLTFTYFFGICTLRFSQNKI